MSAKIIPHPRAGRGLPTQYAVESLALQRLRADHKRLSRRFHLLVICGLAMSIGVVAVEAYFAGVIAAFEKDLGQ